MLFLVTMSYISINEEAICGYVRSYFLCILSLREDNFLHQLEDHSVVRAYVTIFEQVFT